MCFASRRNWTGRKLECYFLVQSCQRIRTRIGTKMYYHVSCIVSIQTQNFISWSTNGLASGQVCENLLISNKRLCLISTINYTIILVSDIALVNINFMKFVLSQTGFYIMYNDVM